MVVRPAEPEDRPQLLELIKGYFAFYRTPASVPYAAAHGYARLDWVTGADNHDAQRFYDRHGGRRGPWISYSATLSDRIDR